jgi:hypothetical protein
LQQADGVHDFDQKRKEKDKTIGGSLRRIKERAKNKFLVDKQSFSDVFVGAYGNGVLF